MVHTIIAEEFSNHTAPRLNEETLPLYILQNIWVSRDFDSSSSILFIPAAN